MKRNTQTVMAVLQEECAEVIQAVSKINRFGMHGEWLGVTNRQALITEIGDDLAIIKVLMKETDINMTEAELEAAIEAKLKKLEIFLPYDT
jgi:NTP pyrophosphatase (non-canonical NTP hydrolase)